MDRLPSPRRRRRGVTLVELMIALAVGLFIVAAAGTLLVDQLSENRRLTSEVRLVQDLRTAADLMTRDLRRAGYWGHAAAGGWQPGSANPPVANPYGAQAPVTPEGVSLRYSRDAVENDVIDGNEHFGYRLRAGIVELQLGLGNWQALTDPATMTVSTLRFAPTTQDVVLDGSCAAACPPGAAACPPRLQVQGLAFEITARSAIDPRVVRSLRSAVRLRNDALVGACPAL